MPVYGSTVLPKYCLLMLGPGCACPRADAVAAGALTAATVPSAASAVASTPTMAGLPIFLLFRCLFIPLRILFVRMMASLRWVPLAGLPWARRPANMRMPTGIVTANIGKVTRCSTKSIINS